MNDIYAPPESSLASDAREILYAGFWIRVLASLLDTLWMLPLTAALGWMIYGAVYFDSEEILMGYADFFISYILPFVLTLLFWAYKSATPGKMAMGIKIVDAQSHDPVPYGRLVIRYLSYFLSILVFGLGFLWVIWDKKKQGWHDKIARTVVIKEG